jgi:bifunctional non-homologous end joining protein LigD
MALEEYQRKRDFRKTPEPSGVTASTPVRRRAAKKAAALSYVIQKHRATRLHYDFRLELDGVLLSWAVPKGPSLDPGEKRLAVHVEDHPIEYGGFEGVIPKGQYGGGTVMLWDRGTWAPVEPDPQAAMRKGALKFRLDGEKLQGNWALVRMGGKAAPKRPGDHENWLLIKERDDVAVPGSDTAVVDDNSLSVATGRAMETIAADRDRVWDSGVGEISSDPPAPAPMQTSVTPAKAGVQSGRRTAALGSRLRGNDGKSQRPEAAKKAALPVRLEPQLAALSERPPDGDEWLHEIKYDGYRLLVRLDDGSVKLLTRKGLDWTAKFPVLAAALAELPVDTALIDGEVVALKPDGTSSFADLQDALSRGNTGGLVFYAFDLLHLDGYDLTGVSLEERKAVLAEIVPPSSHGTLRYSDHQVGRGGDFFAQACNYQLEGTVAKRRDRPYRAGRSSDWLKIKCHSSDEFVVIGFTEPSGHRHGFGALLLGYYDQGGGLHYAGRVGTGFSDAQLAEMQPLLEAIARRTAPAPVPQGTPLKGVRWTEPRLVAQVRYSNWTSDGILRHAAFLGLREDKPPEEVVRPEMVTQNPHSPDAKAAGPSLSGNAGEGSDSSTLKPLARTAGEGAGRRSRKTGEGAAAETDGSRAAGADLQRARDGSITFAGVRLTNPDRVFYPDEGITKLALAQYYEAISRWALPELVERPLSMVRCPEGIGGQHFYQKHDMPGFASVLGRIDIRDKSATETYLFIKDLAGLVAVVQMGVLEIHPWGSTVAKLETPDRITFDFDPDVDLPWERVTVAAIDMREALAGIGLQSFVKTTGGKGLHVVVPVTPKLGWDAIKEFSKWVAEKFEKAYPDRFTTNMAKRARQGRIFIDYLRNGRGATAIGAYSSRAREGAPVATPLSWDEVEAGAKPMDFTVKTVPARLAALTAAPWAEMAGLRQSISARIRKEIGI